MRCGRSQWTSARRLHLSWIAHVVVRWQRGEGVAEASRAVFSVSPGRRRGRTRCAVVLRGGRGSGGRGELSPHADEVPCSRPGCPLAKSTTGWEKQSQRSNVEIKIVRCQRAPARSERAPRLPENGPCVLLLRFCGGEAGFMGARPSGVASVSSLPSQGAGVMKGCIAGRFAGGRKSWRLSFTVVAAIGLGSNQF